MFIKWNKKGKNWLQQVWCNVCISFWKTTRNCHVVKDAWRIDKSLDDISSNQGSVYGERVGLISTKLVLNATVALGLPYANRLAKEKQKYTIKHISIHLSWSIGIPAIAQFSAIPTTIGIISHQVFANCDVMKHLLHHIVPYL